MSLAHNLMVRTLNAIYLQCDGVSKPEDVKDFILFCQCAIEEIGIHHRLEESDLFPAIAEYTGEKEIMETNIAQHHAFEVGLKKFQEYIYAATFETYDGKVVKAMVQEFGGILAVHLADEIPTLLGLDKYGGEKLLGAYKKMEKTMFANLGDKVCGFH
jgi:hemerythrin-like domain-containing protein